MIEPFVINVPDAVLHDLRNRLESTRWPDDFANDDWRYGTKGDYLREVVEYWLRHYDWRAREAMMNGFAHFRTQMDGVPIHFLHERGKGPNPVPILLIHGWPWSFWDYRKVIGPLTDPVAHGGDPADAFDVIVPSLPGFAFSTPLRTAGINWWKTADLLALLMEQLGYCRFAAHGGDVGSFIAAQLGHKYAQNLIGIHLHTAGRLEFMSGIGWQEADYAPEEATFVKRMRQIRGSESGHFVIQATKPQSLAYAFNDSPVGLLAWLIDKRRNWSDCSGDVQKRFSKDDLIDTVMLYWVTQSYHTSARYYYEGAHVPWAPSHDRLPVVEAPTAIALFPAELTFPPRKAAERYYDLRRWTLMVEGGHFAPMEAPAALVDDLRAFFREIR